MGRTKIKKNTTGKGKGKSLAALKKRKQLYGGGINIDIDEFRNLPDLTKAKAAVKPKAKPKSKPFPVQIGKPAPKKARKPAPMQKAIPTPTQGALPALEAESMEEILARDGFKYTTTPQGQNEAGHDALNRQMSEELRRVKGRQGRKPLQGNNRPVGEQVAQEAGIAAGRIIAGGDGTYNDNFGMGGDKNTRFKIPGQIERDKSLTGIGTRPSPEKKPVDPRDARRAN